jgi:hypothetical protein
MIATAIAPRISGIARETSHPGKISNPFPSSIGHAKPKEEYYVFMIGAAVVRQRAQMG